MIITYKYNIIYEFVGDITEQKWTSADWALVYKRFVGSSTQFLIFSIRFFKTKFEPDIM